MSSTDWPDAVSLAIILCGCAVVVVGAGGVAVIPDTEYTTTINPADADEVEQIQTGYKVYEFTDLSEAGQSVFRAALNASDGTITFEDADRTPPEFQYPDDTGGYAYVQYDGAYYSVVTTRSDCFAALCAVARVVAGLFILGGFGVIGLGVRRASRR